jgi:uncharacterized protein with NRDE domain
MCLIILALKSHPSYKLIFAANRDEYYDRPSAPAAFWKEAPGLIAGRDLRAGGTWLGITTRGKITAITNYRDPLTHKTHAPSRGLLVTGFLLGDESPAAYFEMLDQKAGEYNGFNLIAGEKDELYWYSNRGDGPRKLKPGIYGVSNRFLDTPWPKVTRAKEAFQKVISNDKYPDPEAIFHLLADRSPADDKDLPDTGVGIEWERILSSIFITSPVYGTRSSSILLIDMNDRVTFIERTFNSNPEHATTLKYEFNIES